MRVARRNVAKRDGCEEKGNSVRVVYIEEESRGDLQDGVAISHVLNGRLTDSERRRGPAGEISRRVCTAWEEDGLRDPGGYEGLPDTIRVDTTTLTGTARKDRDTQGHEGIIGPSAARP